MMVFLLQPVSARRTAVSSVMVCGERAYRWFISFHSLSDKLTCMFSPPRWYTIVYQKHIREVDVCQPQNSYKK